MAATHLDVGLRCIKYLLCAVNSLFLLTGVMIISVGMTIYAVYDDFRQFLDSSYYSPATILIVVGALVFLIAFFGCCGAIKGSTCMVLVFAVSLSIVLILEVAAAISAYTLQDRIKSVLADRINATMQRYGRYNETTLAIDFLQSRFRCCGVYGQEDWDGIDYPMKTQYAAPDSCCAWTIDVDDDMTGCARVYGDGCIGRMIQLVENSAVNMGSAAIAIALIQFTGIMFACTLGRAIRRQKTERERRKWELRQSLVDGYQPLGKNDPFITFPVVYMKPSDPLKASPMS